MRNLISYLQNLGITVSSELEERLKVFQPISLVKGAYFHRSNTVCNKLGFISQGKVRHYYSIDGNEYTRWVSLENTFTTSFASFINQKPSLDNIECIENCQIYTVSKVEFESLRNDFSEINHLWVTAIEQEMVGYEYRIFQMISHNAELRYLDLLNTNPKFIQKVPQKYLASMLGIDVRHLSRIRKKIASQKS